MARCVPLGCIGGFALLAIAAACSAFGADDAKPVVDAAAPVDGSSSSSSSSGGEPPDSAAQPDTGLPGPSKLAPICPPPDGGTLDRLAFAELAPAGSTPEYPFELVADEQYLYWVATYASSPADTVAAYNGNDKATTAPGRLHRMRLAAPRTVETLRDGDSSPQTIALDGDYVYWSTFDGARIGLSRTRRDCVPPCDADVFPGTIDTLTARRLSRVREGLLLLEALDGRVFKFDAKKPALELVYQAGSEPAPFAALDGRALFASRNDTMATILDVTTLSTATATFKTFDPAKSVGATAIASDCTSAFAWRDDLQIWRAPNIDAGAAFAPQADAGITLVFDMGADAHNVYIASPNANGGMYAFDVATKQTARFWVGNVWRFMVASNGTIYWGDHANAADGTGGAIYAATFH